MTWMLMAMLCLPLDAVQAECRQYTGPIHPELADCRKAAARLEADIRERLAAQGVEPVWLKVGCMAGTDG